MIDKIKNIIDSNFFFELFLLRFSKNPDVMKEKPNKKLPTINSSPKKLTILFGLSLTLPKVLKPNIFSNMTSAKTTNIIIDQ